MTTAEPALPKQAKPGAERRSALFYVLLAAALLIFIQTFALLSPILLSLLLILLISLALNPVIARMRAWTGGRKGAAGLLALAMVGVMGLTGWAFSVPMKDSVAEFAEQLPEYWERLQRPLIKLEQQAVSSEQKLQAEVTTDIALERAAAGVFEAEPAAVEAAPPEPELEPESELGSVRSSLGQMLEGVIGSFAAVAFNGAQILIVLVTVFFGVFYTLMNPRPIFGAMFSLVPDRHHDQALTIMQRIGEFVPRWAGATLLGMVIIGFLVFLLMWPLFGFMDALVLGLIAGILEAVPFVGPLLSAVPALLLAFGEGGMTPLWVVLAYLGIQALENNVILPFVMARGMKLHPLAVIFSMLLCVAAFGVLGVLVAAPLVAIVIILHDELYRKRFLSMVTDADLDRLSRKALHEKVSAKR
ncbi:MAG TPA: AI-2E family transporter [Gammaproteobacteria bacterium]|nr:AI-2E family transporter [Gammaproteobacteria bacterium]